jgi:hypothetical protein
VQNGQFNLASRTMTKGKMVPVGTDLLTSDNQNEHIPLGTELEGTKTKRNSALGR